MPEKFIIQVSTIMQPPGMMLLKIGEDKLIRYVTEDTALPLVLHVTIP